MSTTQADGGAHDGKQWKKEDNFRVISLLSCREEGMGLGVTGRHTMSDSV